MIHMALQEKQFCRAFYKRVVRMNILISNEEGLSSNIVKALSELGANASFSYDGWEDSFCKASEVDVILGNKVIEHWPLDIFSNLKFIQVLNAGMDNVPVKEIKERGILISNGRGILSAYIAEWIMAQILNSTKCIDYFKEKQREHVWIRGNVEAPVISLQGKKACIVGMGDIGKETAKRLHAFEVNVIAVNRSQIKDNPFVDECFLLKDRRVAFSKSDVIIVTMPLTEDTENLLDRDSLEAIKDGAIFINVSRGALVDEKALIDLIKQNKFRTVALDVFRVEPLPNNSELWDLKNVIISPHEAPLAENIDIKRENYALQNLTRYVKGEMPINLF